MSPVEFLSILIDNLRLSWLIVIVISITFFGLWKIIFGKYLNGMIYVQMTSILVFSIVVLLFIVQEISNQSFFIFLSSEVFVIVIVSYAYKNLLRITGRLNMNTKLDRLNSHVIVLLSGLLLILLYDFYLFYNLNSGNSRLTHKVSVLYSFIRIFKNFVSPILYILLFHNVYLNNKLRSLVIFSFLVLASIFSGSKSGFLIVLMISYFIYKDLAQVERVFRSSWNVLYFWVMSLSLAMVNLFIMDVDSEHMIIRIIDFGEAAIMTLPIDNPAETIFKNNSYFSIVHRSLGKLVGDSSSFDLSSLFGFRLHEYFYGSNTLVGPNARIGAIFYSFFERPIIILTISIISIFIYFASSLHSLFKDSNSIHLSYFLILISTYQDVVLDYNKAVSNFTTIIAFFLFTLLFLTLKKSHVKTV